MFQCKVPLVKSGTDEPQIYFRHLQNLNIKQLDQVSCLKSRWRLIKGPRRATNRCHSGRLWYL